MNAYVEGLASHEVDIEICHMDAESAVSWTSYPQQYTVRKHHWFYNWANKEIRAFINISQEAVIPFEARESRLIVHGGGWGIGTYKKAYKQLQSLDYQFDVIAYETGDLEDEASNTRYYLLDPHWEAWTKSENQAYTFPPLYRVEGGQRLEMAPNGCFSNVYNLIKKNKAIISKPGGATILDALSSATPLVYLDAFGHYESTNAKLLDHFGIGISLTAWESRQYAPEVLQDMHERLLQLQPRLLNLIDCFSHYES
jgi:UDP-N-acetylglucosamine:LPS N-acetylglucosamine transferase